MPPLYDEYDELTDFGDWMRIACVLLAILSGIVFVPVSFFAVLGVPMLCDAGCSRPYSDIVSSLALSPLLLIISMFAGAFASRYPTWKLILMSFLGPAFSLITMALLVSA